MNELTKSNILYGNQFIASYKRNNENLGINPISEFSVITVTNIIANTIKTVDLSTIPYSIIFRSLYAYQGSGQQANIKLDLKQGTNILMSITLNSLNLPFQFPCNCVNPAGIKLEILATNNINLLHIFVKQGYIIDVFNY